MMAAQYLPTVGRGQVAARCLHCDRVASLRGCCDRCYDRYRKCIALGEIDDLGLVRQGIFLPRLDRAGTGGWLTASSTAHLFRTQRRTFRPPPRPVYRGGGHVGARYPSSPWYEALPENLAGSAPGLGPTAAPPGSAEKIAVLAARVEAWERGEWRGDLCHPLDARDAGGRSPVTRVAPRKDDHE